MTALSAMFFNLPVMLTEFACPGGAPAAQLAYMQDMLPWLNSQSIIVGYAWCVLSLPLVPSLLGKRVCWNGFIAC